MKERQGTGAPLEGIRVLDLSRVLTGPFCTMMLGDLGADVIKVERPGTGDDTRGWGPPFAGGEAAYFLSVNRNKRSLTCNFREPAGQEIIRRLARQSDVLVENFLPGTLKRFGLDYDSLRQENPGLIYCSISGFGQDGPYRDRPGYDLMLQATGGLMSITGERDGEPVRIGVALVDIGAGMYAAFAILAALRQRDRTGEGRYLDISLLDTEVSWLSYMAQNYLVTGESPGRMGSAHPSIVPYQAFRTADDEWLVLAVGNDAIWERFCRAAEEAGLDPGLRERYPTNAERVRAREEVVGAVARAIRAWPREHWLEVLRRTGVPAAPILSVEEVLQDPQVQHRGMVQTVEHPRIGELRLVGSPLHFAPAAAPIRRPPPTLGQHNTEILRSLGYSPAEIERLASDGIL